MYAHAHACRGYGWRAMSGHRGRRGRNWTYFNMPAAGPRARRGDVRAAILALLAEEPRNGYQLIQEIEARSGGEWRPSPGAIYPALQQLTDEGLIEGTEGEGRKTFRLTDAGRSYVEQHADEVNSPWEAMTS